MARGDIRCIDGRLYRHDPQHDDPDLETDVGACKECGGEGRNCWLCAASHADHRSADGRRFCDECAPCSVCGNEERGQGGYLSCECPAGKAE